jgi:signal transduction histidine kinase
MKTRELQFLVEVSKTLASSLAYEVTLSKVATMTVRQIAHWCTFHVMEASGDPAKPTIRLVALAHREPEMQAWGQDLEQRYPFFSRFEPTLLKDQRPKLYKDRQQVDALFDLAALNAEHRALLAQSDVDSLIALPLLLRDNVSGILTLGFAKSSTGNNLQYLWLGQEIARLAAVSLENARLYREALVQEENLRSLNAELDLRVEQRTHQLQAVNKELEAFSHSVSHDLRTPLRAIDGFSQALIEDYATRLDDQGLSYLRRVREATRRMDHLIDDLLKLSRLTRSELDFAPVDLTRIAHEVIGELRAADTQRQANIVIQDGLVAYGDARLLYIALQNLLGNAWKFSAKRQLATIELGLTHVDGQQAYYVKDNGAGFEMAYASKLFGAFQRLHHAEDFEGNGIGLATVQRILHRHGGQVWAKGALDQGAVFYFTLPITRPNHRQN